MFFSMNSIGTTECPYAKEPQQNEFKRSEYLNLTDKTMKLLEESFGKIAAGKDF